MQKLKRMYIYFLISVAGFPIFGALSVALFGEHIGLALACIYLIGFITYGFIVINSNCPECGKSFFRKIIFYGSGRKCVHCGASLFKKGGE